jgi:hypothetical protein
MAEEGKTTPAPAVVDNKKKDEDGQGESGVHRSAPEEVPFQALPW